MERERRADLRPQAAVVQLRRLVGRRPTPRTPERNRISKWNWNRRNGIASCSRPRAACRTMLQGHTVRFRRHPGRLAGRSHLAQADNRELRVYTTTIPTDHRLHTLMHDPQYRLSVAWQNVGYNQPTQTGFYLGAGMKLPPRQPPTNLKKPDH